MTNRNLAILAVYVFVVAVAFVCGYGFGRVGHFEGADEGVKAKVVQVIKRDTIRLEKPIYLNRIVKEFVLAPARDTVRVSDTLMIALPREVKTYGDSTYSATISGIEPRLEDIEIYRKFETQVVTVTQVQTPPRWGLGVVAGPGVLIDPRGRVHGGLGVSIGIRYSF